MELEFTKLLEGFTIFMLIFSIFKAQIILNTSTYYFNSCESFIYVYAHMHTMVKVISLSEEAYVKLKSIKGERSFSETILDILENKEKKADILDSFGIWADKKEEAEKFKKIVEEDRKKFKLSEVKF